MILTHDDQWHKRGVHLEPRIATETMKLASRREKKKMRDCDPNRQVKVKKVVEEKRREEEQHKD
jgi:hypothetical protein